MNIPIYRAKKIDSDEWVEGCLMYARFIDTDYVPCIQKKPEIGTNSAVEINQNTLAIHFPNMIDKNGKKIFASLSSDGVGGDIVKDCEGYKQLLLFQHHAMIIHGVDYGFFTKDHENDLDMGYEDLGEVEVVGIHKGE